MYTLHTHTIHHTHTPHHTLVPQGDTSAVTRLLEHYGLQHFTDILLCNGFDNVKFLCEVSNKDPEDIGTTDNTDRNKVEMGKRMRVESGVGGQRLKKYVQDGVVGVSRVRRAKGTDKV